MSAISKFGNIVTFYSWKGGVGRTMALANVAVQLARLGRSVLMVDWDLEAPGLERYFQQPDIPEFKVKLATDPSGLLGLLSLSSDSELESSLWENRISDITVPPNPVSYNNLMPPTPGRLHLLGSGFASDGYAAKLTVFSWDRFFADASGGVWLETLRNQWMQRYDFVLIDARTGLTDSGGVCTVQMPDWLVLVFTANEQSLTDGLKIVDAAQQGRRNFAYDRSPLAIVLLLSRWCGDDEVDIGQQWMQRLDQELRPLVSSWLPQQFTPRDFLEKTRVPQIARFAFGEPLPVLTHSLTDTNLPGLAYHTLARLLNSRLTDAGQIIDPAYVPLKHKAGFSDDEELKLLALVQDNTALYQEIARISKSQGPDSGGLINFLNQAGLMLRRLARNAEAEPLYRRSLALAEQRYGDNHTEVAVRLNNLALLLQDTNRLEEAEPLMRRALAIDEQSYGRDHPDVATDLNNLAQLLKSTNRLEEAEPLMRRALAIDEQSYGRDHPDVAIDLNNLAQLLKSTNRLEEAEPLMRRALAIDEQSYGRDHPNVATDLNNLALLLQATNRLEEAEPIMRRALTIGEQSYGGDHPKVATRLNNLAQLLQATNRLEEAEPLMHRALAIGEQSYGGNHPKVATQLNNLASLLKATNRLEEAESLMRRALAIDEQSYGGDHPDVAIDLNNLALLLKATNRLAEAESLSQRAVQIFEDFRDRTGFNHPHSAVAEANYKSILAELNKN